MINAAIYCRKSTDQGEMDEAAKSMARQRENALAVAAAQGWTVAALAIFEEDEGTSGAEFDPTKRPALAALLAACERRPQPFTHLLMARIDRAARDLPRGLTTLQTIHEAGVQMYMFQGGLTHLPFDTPTDQLMASIGLFGSAQERAMAKERTADGQAHRHKLGYSMGQRIYGFDNVKVDVGTDNAHSIREINPAQRDAVRRAFALCAEGLGDWRIALKLSDEGHPLPFSPKPGRRKVRNTAVAWTKNHVKNILKNEASIGRFWYGMTKSVDRKGSVGKSTKVDSAKWALYENKALALVTDDQWAAVRARKAAMVKKQSPKGTTRVRLDTGLETSYFLNNFLRCGSCGGAMAMAGDKVRPRYYCSARLHTVGSTCETVHGVPCKELDDAVVEAVTALLADNGKVLAGILAAADVRLRAEAAVGVGRWQRAQDEAAALDAQTANLIRLAGVGKGGAVEKIMQQIQANEEQAAALRRVEKEPEPFDPAAFRQRFAPLVRMGMFMLTTGDPTGTEAEAYVEPGPNLRLTEGRKLLRALGLGKQSITVTPRVPPADFPKGTKCWEFSAACDLGALAGGVANHSVVGEPLGSARSCFARGGSYG